MKFEDFTAKQMLEAANRPSHLSEREKHFIGIAVALTRGCLDCSGSRISWALDSGIPMDAIVQAIDVASAVNAGVTTKIAMVGFDAVERGKNCAESACTVGLDAPR